MAIAVESSATASDLGTNSSITISKPTGTVEDDVLVAGIISADFSEPANATSIGSTGWSSFFNHKDSGSTGSMLSSLYKKAGSSEPADYTFSINNGNADFLGFILRLSGASLVDITGDPFSQRNAASSSFDSDNASTGAISVTPSYDNSLFIMIVGSRDGSAVAARTVSGYSAGSLTWTEQTDTTDVGGDRLVLASATATQSSAAAISRIQASFSAATADHFGALINVIPVIDATGTFTHLAVTPAFHAPSGSADTTGTHAHLAVSPTINAPTAGVTDENRWTEDNKTSKTWIEQDK